MKISPQLYFYVLCRKVLSGTPVKSREASDYVASLLDGFTRTARLEDEGGQRSMRYISDMMQALPKAGTHEAFLLRSHTANYALFVSGIFAGNLEKVTRRRGAPGVAFYEAMGQMNYRAASEYREAKKFNLQSVYEELAGGFNEVRIALNDLADRLLHFETPPGPIIAA